MKKILTFMLFTISVYVVKSQNPTWSIPINYIPDLMYPSLIAPLLTLLSPYTSNHNAYPAPDGNLGFYVVDEYVYDGNGSLVGAMWLPTNSGGSQWPETRGFSEIAIAPHPTDCNRFRYF